MSLSTLKKSWPLIGASLLVGGLTYLGYKQYHKSKSGCGCKAAAVAAAATASGAAEGKSGGVGVGGAFEYETDNATQSNYRSVAVQSFHLNLSADFTRKVLSGYVDLKVKALVPNATELVLDTRGLTIRGAQLISHSAPKSELKSWMGAAHDVLGSALSVALPAIDGKPAKVGAQWTVRINYETTPESSAIQWLPPAQTAGKKHPYLFTQCQAIHARALFPCQDTPAVKATYTGAITVPDPLVALMSAVSTTAIKHAAEDKKGAAATGTTTYHFEQRVCIPSYLVAIAIGALEKRDISPRCAVWSEKETVDAGLHEFAETEKFLAAAEEICGPYVWGRYDVLLLPPSFPYGGMENPCLTFVTPTLLAGDRSLANVVAHEIAHSWSGNLVSNITWQHFWCNEGFTVFIERKIMQRLYGKQMRDLHAAGGHKGLCDDVKRFTETGHPEFTRLVPPIERGTDPDDAFSSVPYERGFQLLFYLEGLIGESNMAAYIKHHFKTHAYGHIQTEQFIAEFLAFAKGRGVSDSVLNGVDWSAWRNADGLPPVEPKFDRTLIGEAQLVAEAFASGAVGTSDINFDVARWGSAQTTVCLERLEDLQSKAFAELKGDALESVKAKWRAQLKAVDARYHFTQSKNSEIRFRWYVVGIRADWEAVFPGAVQFLTSQGRMKFTRPLYRELFKSPKGSALAVSTFQNHSANYHSICAKMVARDLGLTKE